MGKKVKQAKGFWEAYLVNGFFYDFITNLVMPFKRYYYLYLLAIILTAILVFSGFDSIYFLFFRGNFVFQRLLWPAVIIGGVLPWLVPITVFIKGLIRKSYLIKNTAFCLGQAAILSYIVTSFFKALTGRMSPRSFQGTEMIDSFRFGFLEGGIFNGWPSGHTMTAFAMAISLVMMYPKNKVIKYSAITYAIYIGMGISTNIHWFSEFVAGALMGMGIGFVVGKSFYNKIKKRN